MTLGNRLREARKRCGYTQRQLAEKIGAKHNSVSNWENSLNMPDPVTIEYICSVLDVTPNYLLRGNEQGIALRSHGDTSSAEDALLRKYRDLDQAAKGAVDALLDYYSGIFAARTVGLHAMRENMPLTNVGATAIDPPDFEIVRGLISAQSVAAGTGTYLDPDAFETISVRKTDLTRRADFYVSVSGDSMEPRFHDADILIIEKTAVNYGEIGIFTLDGHGFVKVRGKGELISLNRDYDPIPMNDNIICNGKVIGVLDPDLLIND